MNIPLRARFDNDTFMQPGSREFKKVNKMITIDENFQKYISHLDDGYNNDSYADPYELFLYALKSSETKRQYPRRLNVFFDFLVSINELEENKDLKEQCRICVTKIKNNQRWLSNALIQFISFQKERIVKKEVVAITVRNYIRALKLFIDMNFDTPPVSWKKISIGLPPVKETANDRAPTIEEIQKIIEYPDRRIKPIILSMVSGGFRLGAWDYLRWKHIIPLKDEKERVIAAKLIIYAEEPEEYFCFITPEAYSSIKNWMDYRHECGEEINGESWIVRNMWQSTDFMYGAKWGLVKYPKKLEATGVKSLIERAIRSQGVIKKPLLGNTKRREWKSVHGYRKFFKSQAEQVMKPINVEILLGHSIGLSGAYYRPTEKQILEDYLNAIDLLTINEKMKLSEKVRELAEKDKNKEYILNGKIREKENEIYEMKKQISFLMESQKEIYEFLKHPDKLTQISLEQN